MPDDRTSQDQRDRSQVAAGEPYEVQYFAKKNGISVEQAEDLIRTYGNNREALEAAIVRIK